MRRFIKYFQFGLALLVTLLILEIFIKVTGTSITPWTYRDSKMGRMFRPGARVVHFNEGFGLGRINKYGYIGPAFDPEKDNGVLRIALVGDSNIAGHLLFERHTIARILEYQLSSLINKNVEVLNFGWSGPNLQRLYINYQKWAQPFNADYYLIFIGKKKMLKSMALSRAHCYGDGDSLEIRYGNPPRLMKSFFLRNLSLYQLARRAIKRIIKKSSQLFGSAKNTGNDQEYQDEALLFSINRLIIKTFEQINSRQKQQIILVIDNEIPEEYLSLINDFAGYTIDLRAQLMRMKKAGIDPYYWKATGIYGHWNQQAHQMAGRYLARQFVNIIVNKMKQ